MKPKLFLTIILLTIYSFSFCQNTKSEHLTFKGVPIDGTLNNFVSKMKQNGFIYINTEEGLAILKGDFATYKDCIVGVSTLKNKDLVHKVVVIFPDRLTWSALHGNYSNLKQMLTEKYGQSINETEEFNSEIKPLDDNSKMFEVKFDRCKYQSIWQTDRGEIQLTISHNSVTNCFVTLAYFDYTNSEEVRKNGKDDL